LKSQRNVMNKSGWLFCFVFFSFQSLHAQELNDTVQEVKNFDAKIIVNAGYSIVNNVKAGVLFKIKGNCYGEIAYGYRIYTPPPNAAVHYDERIDRYLIGINYYPFKHNFTQYTFTVTYLQDKSMDENSKALLFSPNIGTTSVFHSKSNKGFNMIARIGIFIVFAKNTNEDSYHLSAYGTIPSCIIPNVELSFRYGF
jgi:hypothetical protein